MYKKRLCRPFHPYFFGVFALISLSAQSATTITYTYDDLNRLGAVSRSDGPSLSYSYDEVGNITVHTSTNPDTDGDLLKDIEETAYGLNINSSDTDGDTLTDYFEICFDGDCTTYSPYPAGGDLNAALLDTDGDGVNDDVEIAAGTDPLNSSSFPTVADGDLNGDSVVDVADVLLGYQIINGTVTPTAAQLQRGDVAPLVAGVPQPNGVFNLGDLLLIQRKVLGLISF